MIPLFTGISYPIILSLGLIIYLVKNFRNINLSPNFVIIIFIITWELIHLYNTSFKFNEFLTLAVILVWFGLIIFDIELVNKLNREKIITIFAFSSIILSSLVLLQILQNVSFNEYLSKQMRLGTINFPRLRMSVNPNTIGLYSISSLALIFSLNKRHNSNVVNNFLIILLLTSGILTYSRTFILSILILFLVSIFNFNKKSRSFLILILILILFLIIYYKNPIIINNILMRFQVDDLSNNRVDIFNLYNNFLKNNISSLLFGVGIQDYQAKTNILISIHNPIQEILVVWGVVGLILVVNLIVKSISVASKDNKRMKFNLLLPLIIYFISLQTSRILSTPVNILILLVMIITINEK